MARYITKEGLEKLKQELETLKEKRLEIGERIQDAKSHGDLSENAEYAEAKELQAFNEGRIAEIEEMLKNAVLIEEKKSGDKVAVGCSVEVHSKGKVMKFRIVGSEEADPANFVISNESPLGKAFLGRKKGEEVTVETPVGKAKYKITDIQ